MRAQCSKLQVLPAVSRCTRLPGLTASTDEGSRLPEPPCLQGSRNPDTCRFLHHFRVPRLVQGFPQGSPGLQGCNVTGQKFQTHTRIPRMQVFKVLRFFPSFWGFSTDPESRAVGMLQQGSNKISARFQHDLRRVPARFWEGSTKVPGLFRFFGVCICVSPLPGFRD